MVRKDAAWAVEMAPRTRRYEEEVRIITGCGAMLTCDSLTDQLVLTLSGAPHPAALDRIIDVLSPLWPGFLAPAGVSLVLVDSGEWDCEEMALRYHQRRTAG